MCVCIAAVSAIRRIQGQKITWWEGQKGLAFLRDIRLVDGELVVPRPGRYYVYAQTYFRHSHPQEEEGEEGEDEDRGRPMLQYVYKKVRMPWIAPYSHPHTNGVASYPPSSPPFVPDIVPFQTVVHSRLC